MFYTFVAYGPGTVFFLIGAYWAYRSATAAGVTEFTFKLLMIQGACMLVHVGGNPVSPWCKYLLRTIFYTLPAPDADIILSGCISASVMTLTSLILGPNSLVSSV